MVREFLRRRVRGTVSERPHRGRGAVAMAAASALVVGLLGAIGVAAAPR